MFQCWTPGEQEQRLGGCRKPIMSSGRQDSLPKNEAGVAEALLDLLEKSHRQDYPRLKRLVIVV